MSLQEYLRKIDFFHLVIVVNYGCGIFHKKLYTSKISKCELDFMMLDINN